MRDETKRFSVNHARVNPLIIDMRLDDRMRRIPKYINRRSLDGIPDKLATPAEAFGKWRPVPGTYI